MRFVDSNVFVHAVLKPRRRLEGHEAEIKEAAKRILLRLEDGEDASTTVVHLSEVANLLDCSIRSRDLLCPCAGDIRESRYPPHISLCHSYL